MSMKRNRKRKSNSNSQTGQPVHLHFSHPTATTVAIAGSFNDWRPEAMLMVAVEDGRWVKELNLPSGTYEYLFIVDGQWMPDPSAKENVANPYGGVNSVVTVPERNYGK